MAGMRTIRVRSGTRNYDYEMPTVYKFFYSFTDCSVKGIARIEFILNDTSYKFSFTLSAFPMSMTTTLEFSSCFQSDFGRLI